MGSDTATVTVNVVIEPEQTIFNLAARPKSGEVDLTWSPVDGADGYNVYRGTTQSGPYELIVTGHQTDYAV